MRKQELQEAYKQQKQQKKTQQPKTPAQPQAQHAQASTYTPRRTLIKSIRSISPWVLYKQKWKKNSQGGYSNKKTVKQRRPSRAGRVVDFQLLGSKIPGGHDLQTRCLPYYGYYMLLLLQLSNATTLTRTLTTDHYHDYYHYYHSGIRGSNPCLRGSLCGLRVWVSGLGFSAGFIGCGV